jgi:hypothetical protein
MAATVVVFQFPIARWVSKYRSLIVMAEGLRERATGWWFRRTRTTQ